MTGAIFPIRRLALLGGLLSLPLMLVLAGCQGSLQTRWAQTSDSPDAWAPRMPGLPLDLRGTQAALLNQLPQATNSLAYGQAHPAGAVLAAVPRVELYVGGDRIATAASYCSAKPSLYTIDPPNHGVMVAAALCDGSRLVVSMRRGFSPDRLAADKGARAVHTVESRLLFGLSMSRAQWPTQSNY